MANNIFSATNNPVTNVQQVSNNTAVQANQAMAQTARQAQPQQTQVQQNQTATVETSPVTIPIQIQPQIATTSGNVNSQQANMQNLQTNNQNVSSAPTPQTYDSSNTNTNVVDFNQIYNGYQQQYGKYNNTQNTNSNYNSGVKKTSIGTTIVTPTVQNINSVEGQYQSAYADTINGIIGEMLNQMNKGFEYEPTQDNSLKVATEYAANTTLQSLAGSGVLNSSATAERVARIVGELIPQYEEKAHSRWIEYLGQLADTAQVVMSYDSQQFQYWKDAKDREFENKQFEWKKKEQELEDAWKRVDELGYVDNGASTILGVSVGTLSKDAREAKEEREFELKKMQEQAQLEYENNKALYQLRAELDKEQTDYEYQLSVKYGGSKTSSSSNSNYSRYDEIIRNRYASYDKMNKQYVVPDENTYNELGKYLDSLSASGAIDDETLAQLAAKYSKYNKNSTINNTTMNSGLSDDNLSTWIKALDGNNKALDTLGVTIWGQKKSNVNNNDAKSAVNKALNEITEGTYIFTTNQELMNDLKNERFGKLRWGL
nr:MAG TPA: hypothetical protein [Caudoviricetes sp.]